ncbi:peptidylprolyl isomerase [Paenibacillus psychroresistens]|uniref:Peptidyl-prolyl cis-trans isomerase n=2 Tax=Paenibacillus psychroresistens TaxID=1778678 RepID=A0A6B8RZ83_9BACL|nr:peptidylprolyl isomerase [Paenibacillus psychroresistens]
MSACGKVKNLTEGQSVAPSQAPAASVAPAAAESLCTKAVQATPVDKTISTVKSYAAAPEMTIDASKTYCAIVQTSKGNLTLELFAKDAPKTVNNFVFLAKNNFYNGIIFHRIIQSFMIQTGDPEGTGAGGPGYSFEDELTGPQNYEPGVVAMANAGANTNGSQFFINTVDNSKNLPKNYSIFGKVVAGMDTVTKIAATPVEAGGEGSTPTEKVTIDSVQIIEL